MGDDVDADRSSASLSSSATSTFTALPSSSASNVIVRVVLDDAASNGTVMQRSQRHFTVEERCVHGYSLLLLLALL